MRKRNCDRIFDNILWYTIYLLPIILTCIAMFGLTRSSTILEWNEYEGNVGVMDMSFWSVLMSSCRSLGVSNSNFFFIVFQYFSNIELGLSLTLMDGNVNSGILWYLSYFCSVYLFHLALDFLLFIPRLCHKWMNAYTKED